MGGHEILKAAQNEEPYIVRQPSTDKASSLSIFFIGSVCNPWTRSIVGFVPIC